MRKKCKRRETSKILHRVDPASAGAAGPSLKVQVISCRVTGAAHLADHHALVDSLTRSYSPGRHVGIQRLRPIRVPQNNIVSIRCIIGRFGHHTGFRRQDGRATGCRQVDTAVQFSTMIRAVPIRKGRGNSGIARQGPGVAPATRLDGAVFFCRLVGF